MRFNSSLTLFLTLVLFGFWYINKQFPSNNQKNNIPLTLLSRQESKIYKTDLETYLIGVVAAEMPALFSMEALKAQAVASRTLILHRLKRFGGNGCKQYERADICDDPSTNQAWVSPSGLKQKWRDNNFRELYYKVEQAVKETARIIMIYNGKPIDAVFHSTCGGRTVAAKEIWQYDIPYLQSVNCPKDDHSPYFRKEYYFNSLDLASRLNIPVSQTKAIQIGQRFETGRVQWVNAGISRFSGEEFRKKLDIASSRFYLKKTQEGLIITTIGYGHGVGLCQYGADGLAKQGWNYREILQYYYRGVRLKKLR